MTNRKWIGMLAFVALFCLLSGAPSFAGVIDPGNTIHFSIAIPHPSGFNGGAFAAVATPSGFSWYSFCIEMNEYIDLSSPFIVDSISGTAWNGGLGVSSIPGTALPGTAPGTGDPISSQTAYLYSLYATGGLGFTGPGSEAQQRALQNVFWYLENEIVTKPTDALSLSYFELIKDIKEDGNLYGVLVVNPVNSAGVPAQSQLVYVPEPGSFLLLGSGLIGLIGYRRKRRME